MADDTELVKAVIQGMTEGFTAPLAKIIDAIFGKAATQIGLALEDRAKEYRERQRRFFRRSKEMLDSTGKQPSKVPLKLLLPILQNGSVEEDDELQDRWAALLANASLGTRVPGAIEVLAQLTTYDVLLLQSCYAFVRNIELTKRYAEEQEAARNTTMLPPFDPSQFPLAEPFGNWQMTVAQRVHHNWVHTSRFGSPEEFSLTRENLERLDLLIYRDSSPFLTGFGYRVASACQPPVRVEVSRSLE
jgi:hypothetical protein